MDKHSDAIMKVVTPPEMANKLFVFIRRGSTISASNCALTFRPSKINSGCATRQI